MYISNTAKRLSAVSLAAAALGVSQTRTVSQAGCDSKKPKLIYFNIEGRAFPIRAALRHGNVEFEDYRLKDYGELVAMRGPDGANEKIPLGVVPVLELPDGHVIAQSLALLRWAGKQSGLYPEDILIAAIVDEACDSVAEVRSKL